MNTKKRKIVIIAAVIIAIIALMFYSQSKSNLIRVLSGPESGTSRVFTSADKIVVLSRANEIYTWEWDNLKKWPTAAHLNTGIATVINGQKIIYATAGQEGFLKISDLKLEKKPETIPLPFGTKCIMLQPSETGSCALGLLKPEITGDKSELVVIKDELKSAEKIISRNFADDKIDIYNIAISNDASVIAAVGEKNGGWVMVADVESKKIIFEKVVRDIERFDTVAFSPDDKIIYAGERIRFIYAFSTSDGKLIRKYEIPLYQTPSNQKQNISCVKVSPDARILAADTEPAGNVWFWNTQTGQKINTIHANSLTVPDIAFSPDGKMLAAGCMVRPTIRIFKVPHVKNSNSKSEKPVNDQ